MVAHYAAQHFPSTLLQTKLLSPGMPDAVFVAKSKEAFEVSMLKIDEAMRHLPEVESGQDRSGSTSVMTLIGPRCRLIGNLRIIHFHPTW